MPERAPIDPSQSIIHYEDEPTLPPPRLEVGPQGWLRQNLFGSPADAVTTIIVSLLVVALAVGFFDWAIGSANWFAIVNNQRLFMMSSFEPVFEWRVALTVLLSALLCGMSLAAWARRSLRILTVLSLILALALALLPPLVEATIAQPKSYFTAGNIDIVDRASALTPQKELAFIAREGETVSVALALDEVADIESLSRLAGFADRATNALANSAGNLLETRAKTGEIFDRMLSRELTEALEERTRLNIRTFTRTNDMLASTAALVAYVGAGLDESGATVAELRTWLERLERAAKAQDPRDDSILEALTAAEEATKTLSLSDGMTQEARETMARLTAAILASEQLEDLGETLVLQISEDLIGEPDQRDEDEELIQPSAKEAAFLRDVFTRLLTPQSALELYALGQRPMTAAILNGDMTETLAEAELAGPGHSLSFTVPRSGWYVLRKDAAAGETGSAILAASGIEPIVQRTLSATESLFSRLTDNELVVSESRPQVDGKAIPFVVLIDNQFRGLRSPQAYLIHFIPPFFEQLEALFIPFFITMVLGYSLGRGAAHARGENSVFRSRGGRMLALAWSLGPLLILLAYFALVDGDGVFTGLFALVLKLAAVFGAVLAARRGEAWLNRTNSGDEAEGSINRLLLYGWGAYPFLMYVLASGVGGLSGATLGSMVGGLIWLLLIYLVGLHYEGVLGYALLVGAFFLQIAQGFVVNLVWQGWNATPVSALLMWLLLAGIGVFAGARGASLSASLGFSLKRYGYLLGCVAFLFVFLDTNTLSGGDGAAGLLAGAAILFWLAWMFFSGAVKWTSNRLITGLLLLTFLWMQSWTAVDRWSTIYFMLWLAAGVVAFKRGEGAQSEKRKTLDGEDYALGRRYSLQAAALAALAWLGALLVIPSLIAGLGAAQILQASPEELLPVSDKRLWGGLMLTMQLTVLGIGASFPIGLALAIGRRSNLTVVKYACILYIELVRGVPLITVLFLATLLVPLVDPTLATIEQAVRAWVGITMFSAAYLAENVRGGLQSVDRGQTEAAQAIGLSAWQTTLHILLPQALRAVIPALVGQFISLFKDTSLVYIVGLAEITGIAQRVVAQPEFLQRRQETFLYVAIIYFVFSYIMSYISRRVEATGSGAARAQQL